MSEQAITTQVLQPGDEARLEEFLLPYAESAMFLRSNARSGGLVDRGETLQGTYVGAFQGSELRGVVSHCWNGMILVQVPAADGDRNDHLGTDHLQTDRFQIMAALLRHVVQETGRPIGGFAAPWDQAVMAREILGLEEEATTLNSREDLFLCSLEKLRVPAALSEGAVVCRQPHHDALEMLAQWHVEYCEEALGRAPSVELLEECRSEMQRLQRDQIHFLLVSGTTAEPLAYCAYNSHLPDCVQIGGVWTPPPLRGRGYAKCVVAGSLLAARERGADSSILFTGDDNVPAQRAYLGIGYEIVGDYGLIIFRDPKSWDGSGYSGSSEPDSNRGNSNRGDPNRCRAR